MKWDEITWQFPSIWGVKKGTGVQERAGPMLLEEGTDADEPLQAGDWISLSGSVVWAAATSALLNRRAFGGGYISASRVLLCEGEF